MRQLSSRYTRTFRSFTLTLRRCLAAGRRGSTAVIISRPCRCSPGSGATPRIRPRRFRRQPGGCSGFSPILPGTMQRLDAAIIGRLQEYLGSRLGHPEALCLLGGAFLLSLQPAWGKKMPRITRPQVYRVVREMLPRERCGPFELLRWLEETQERNEGASRSHAKRRAALRASPGIPP